MLVIDFSRRVYLVVSIDHGVVKLLERGSAGPDELRRNRDEMECVAVRHLPEEDFHRLFSPLTTNSAGDLLRTWAAHWPFTDEALEISNNVLYIEDAVEYLRAHAAERNPRHALATAHAIRARARTYRDDSVPVKYDFKPKPVMMQRGRVRSIIPPTPRNPKPFAFSTPKKPAAMKSAAPAPFSFSKTPGRK